MRFLLPILCTLFLASCTKFELLDLTIPHYGYTREKNIAYGKAPRQTLDIYMPEYTPDEPAPVIVFFYGGSWQRGAKEDYRFVGESLASKGYVAIIANYRLYPEVTFPGFVEDSALATAWAHANIAKYGGDPENLYVAGHSAGAYNALMLALDEHYLKDIGGNTRWLRGAIGLSGPYDFLPVEDKTITAIFEGAAHEVTQPARLRYRKTHLPAIMLATGKNDTLVVPKNTESLASSLTKLGLKVETHYYEGVDHPTVAQALATPFTRLAPVLDDIDGFIERTKK